MESPKSHSLVGDSYFETPLNGAHAAALARRSLKVLETKEAVAVLRVATAMFSEWISLITAQIQGNFQLLQGIQQFQEMFNL